MQTGSRRGCIRPLVTDWEERGLYADTASAYTTTNTVCPQPPSPGLTIGVIAVTQRISLSLPATALHAVSAPAGHSNRLS